MDIETHSDWIRTLLTKNKDIKGLIDKMYFASHGKPMNYLTSGGVS